MWRGVFCLCKCLTSARRWRRRQTRTCGLRHTVTRTRRRRHSVTRTWRGRHVNRRRRHLTLTTFTLITFPFTLITFALTLTAFPITFAVTLITFAVTLITVTFALITFAFAALSVALTTQNDFVAEISPMPDFLRLNGLNVQIVDRRGFRLRADKQQTCGGGDKKFLHGYHAPFEMFCKLI